MTGYLFILVDQLKSQEEKKEKRKEKKERLLESLCRHTPHHWQELAALL